MTTIAVIGPGAVGGALAVHLELRHPGAVCVAARTPFAGLEVRTGEALLRATPTVIDSPTDGRPVDWVLITTKAYDAAPAAEWVRALIDVHSRVAVVQNGVEHVERFAPYVPTEQLVPVVVDLPAHRTAPGRVVQRGTAALTAPASSDGRRFCDLFAGTAVTARTTDDFTTAAWTKLVFNATGAITAASSAPRLTMDRAATQRLVEQVLAEAIAVGRAEGARLPDSLAVQIMQALEVSTSTAPNSMHADRLAGRRMEIEARNGAIVRIGARHGVPTPVNALLVDLLSSVDHG